jgi:oxygen-independent coproporphyrinogen-3 oxidase
MAGLYIHIPFCTQRCVYCDFFSQTEMGFRQPFVSALIREMELRRDYLGGEALDTVYLGGGTPSLLSPAELEHLFIAIYRHFDTTQCKEVTLEANPDDLSPDYVQALRSLPVNRISIGVQSFDEADLLFLNRRHNRKQAIEAVASCRNEGFTNLSIDLIYGLPGQTTKKWAANLQEAVGLDLPHISAYHLTYEEGTALAGMRDKGLVAPVSEDSSLAFFATLMDTLTASGYQHYEISNFARSGYISRHNSAYWTGHKYLGLGPSAHSYNGVSREWNVSHLPSYLQGITGGEPVREVETADTAMRYNDYVITRLRTMWGIGYAEMAELFGERYLTHFHKEAEPFIRRGLLEVTNEGVRLSKEGIFLSDGVMRELLWV